MNEGRKEQAHPHHLRDLSLGAMDGETDRLIDRHRQIDRHGQTDKQGETYAGTKGEKTSDAGSQYRCGRVGRGIQPLALHGVTPFSPTHIPNITAAS